METGIGIYIPYMGLTKKQINPVRTLQYKIYHIVPPIVRNARLVKIGEEGPAIQVIAV